MSNKNRNNTNTDSEFYSNEVLYKRQQDATAALAIIHAVCQAENIQYFLLAGSCLGAIRNNGMIPWDDDIDIGLKLSEYEKLRRILPKYLVNTGYEFYDYHIDPNFPRMYGKILKDGWAVIDLFKLVPMSNSTVQQILHWYQKRFWNGIRSHALWQPTQFMSNRKKISYYIKQMIFLPFMKICPRDRIINKLEKIEKKYYDNSAQYYSNFFSVYSRRKELIPAEWIEQPIWTTFEDMECPIVSAPDKYLRKLYGDYMTPPSKADRKSRHLFDRFE